MRNIHHPYSSIIKREALDILKDLHEPKKFIFQKQTTSSERELLKDIKITDTASNVTIRVKSLFDSGCTGSCISQQLVDKKGLTTQI